jgi:hypothetical protein
MSTSAQSIAAQIKALEAKVAGPKSETPEQTIARLKAELAATKRVHPTASMEVSDGIVTISFPVPASWNATATGKSETCYVHIPPVEQDGSTYRGGLNLFRK